MAENYISTQYEKGSVSISEDVIAVMTAAAISEVEGVASLTNTAGGELMDILSKKSVAKGVKVAFEESRVVVDALVMVRFGFSITTVAEKIQETVSSAIESMTGLTATVNVHVTGVAFDKN